MNSDQAKKSSAVVTEKKQQLERNHFVWANAIQQAREELELSIKEGSDKFSAEQLLAFSIFFAASESGICFKQGLIAFGNTLLFQRKPFWVPDDHLHVELNYEHPSHPIPQQTDDELSARMPVLGPLTFSATTGLINKRKNLRIGATLDEKSVWHFLKKHCLSKDTDNPKVLSQFCVGAAKYLDRVSTNPLPIFLREYAKGIHSSTPPPKGNLLKKKTEVRFENQIQPAQIVTRPEPQTVTRACNSNEDSDFDVKKFEKHLTNAFKDTDERGAKRKAKDVRNSLKAIAGGYCSLPPIAELIIDYFIACFSDDTPLKSIPNWTSPSSARRAKGSFVRAILTESKGLDLPTLDQDDMDEFCSNIEQFKKRPPKEKSNFLANLEPFFAYAKEYASWSVPATYFNEKSRRKERVRNYVFDESFFHQFRSDVAESLQKSFESERTQMTIDIALLLARRLFLRPSELWSLMLKDVEESADLFVFIRANKWGGLKTWYARRSLPFSIFALDGEVEILRNFILRRKRELQQAGRTNGLLFSEDPFVDKPFNSSTMSSWFGKFLSRRFGQPCVFYQWRHTGITELMVVMFANEHNAQKRTPYNAEKIMAIRQYLGNGCTQNQLYEVSRLCGHIEPKTTLRNYSHRTDYLIFDRLLNGVTVDSQIVSRLAGIKPLGQQEQWSYSETLYRLSGKLKKYTEANVSSINEPDVGPPEIYQCNTKLDQCIHALQLIDKGLNVAEVSSRASTCSETIQQWVESAKRVKTYFSTSKRVSRLFKSNDLNIGPKLRYDSFEATLLKEIQKGLFKLYREKPNSFVWLLNTVLSNVSHDHSEVVLKCPEIASKIICLTESFIPESHWRVEVDPLIDCDDSCTSAWSSVSPKVSVTKTKCSVKRKSTFPSGRGRLFLNHPRQRTKSKSGGIQNYSSAVLKYCLHCIAIYHWNELQSFFDGTD